MANNHHDEMFDEDRDDKRTGKVLGRGGRRRRKMCRFCVEDDSVIDYKNSQLLKFFVTDRGKMIPRRITGTCAKHQRKLAIEIKKSRTIALMPFTVTGR